MMAGKLQRHQCFFDCRDSDELVRELLEFSPLAQRAAKKLLNG
jgi:hypothetical protein